MPSHWMARKRFSPKRQEIKAVNKGCMPMISAARPAGTPSLIAANRQPR
ncbi:Uncharacterised protein [Chromobacterium violaceum]|uniref:Uncharacterized protein n=1 Tax=Chromobacterium violaceum TaxID=536 RepID=A0A3S4JWJ0_CHRVL|nr:Uncharacterised protein [Chromobacterium violaceum]